MASHVSRSAAAHHAVHHHHEGHHEGHHEHHHEHHDEHHHEGHEGLLEHIEEALGVDEASDEDDLFQHKEPVTAEEKLRDERMKRCFTQTSKRLETVAQMRMDAEIWEDLAEERVIDTWGEQKFGLKKFGKKFTGIVTAFVCLNAITIGVETDAKSPTVKSTLGVLEHVYCAVFAIECCIRISVDAKAYFTTPITFVDFMLVCCAVFDTWLMPLVASKSGMGKLSLLRVIRLLRLVRLIKLARAFKKLYLLVCGLMSGLSTLMWVGLLMFVSLYMCAIFCVQIIGKDPETWAEEEEFDPEKYFANIPYAMLSLWECLNDGCTGDIVRPVVKRKPWMFLFFATFVMLLIYGFLNILVGVFCDGTMESANEQEAMIRRQGELLHNVDKAALNSLWEVVNRSGDEYINKRDFLRAYNNEDAHEVISRLELGEIESGELFATLDRNNNGKISVEELVEGAMKCRGALRQPEIATYMHEKRAEAQMATCFDKVLRVRKVLASKGVKFGSENEESPKKSKTKSPEVGSSVRQLIPGLRRGSFSSLEDVEEEKDQEGIEKDEEPLEKIDREIAEEIDGQHGWFFSLRFSNPDYEKVYLLSLGPNTLQWLKVSLAVLTVLLVTMIPVESELPMKILAVRIAYRVFALGIAVALTLIAQKCLNSMDPEKPLETKLPLGQSIQELVVWALLFQAICSALVQPQRLAVLMKLDVVMPSKELGLWWECMVLLFSTFGTTMPACFQWNLISRNFLIRLFMEIILDRYILKLPIDVAEVGAREFLPYASLCYVLALVAYNFDLDRRRSYLLQYHLEMMTDGHFDDIPEQHATPSKGGSWSGVTPSGGKTPQGGFEGLLATPSSGKTQ